MELRSILDPLPVIVKNIDMSIYKPGIINLGPSLMNKRTLHGVLKATSGFRKTSLYAAISKMT
jgi:hypothetical protein